MVSLVCFGIPATKYLLTTLQNTFPPKYHVSMHTRYFYTLNVSLRMQLLLTCEGVLLWAGLQLDRTRGASPSSNTKSKFTLLVYSH